jgi:hypothetical protein
MTLLDRFLRRFFTKKNLRSELRRIRNQYQ